MIKEIIKEIAGFYNKKVVFDTEFSTVEPNSKSFKLSEEVINGKTHIMIVRITEYDDYVKVFKLKIQTIENDLRKLNP